MLRAAGDGRVAVVSDFFHLPRVKLAYERMGYDVITVPSRAHRIPQTTRLVLREVPAFWVLLPARRPALGPAAARHARLLARRRSRGVSGRRRDRAPAELRADHHGAVQEKADALRPRLAYHRSRPPGESIREEAPAFGGRHRSGGSAAPVGSPSHGVGSRSDTEWVARRRPGPPDRRRRAESGGLVYGITWSCLACFTRGCCSAPWLTPTSSASTQAGLWRCPA